MGGGLVRLRGECSVGCDGLNLSDGGGGKFVRWWGVVLVVIAVGLCVMGMCDGVKFVRLWGSDDYAWVVVNELEFGVGLSG